MTNKYLEKIAEGTASDVAYPLAGATVGGGIGAALGRAAGATTGIKDTMNKWTLRSGLAGGALGLAAGGAAAYAKHKELKKEASAWGAIGRVVQKAGTKLGATPKLKVGQMGPAPKPGFGDKVHQFGKDLRSGRGNARMYTAAGGALATGIVAGRMSKSDGT